MTINSIVKAPTYKLILLTKAFFGFFCSLILLNIFVAPVFANTSVISTASVIPVCGNTVKEEGEACDNSDLGGQTCQSRGFLGGNLSCNTDCTFNTSQCARESGGGVGGERRLNPLSDQSLSGAEIQKTDANNDGRVDLLDFNILMVNWGAVGPNVADFNKDGIVDIFDFNLLMIYWTL